jgi:hypothetical protein
MKLSESILAAALEGLTAKRERINSHIAEIQATLGRPAAKSSPRKATGRRKRPPMSAAARKRIAEAQHKRWAAYHKERAQA